MIIHVKNVTVVSYVLVVQTFIRQPIEWPNPKQHWESRIIEWTVSPFDSMNLVVFAAPTSKSLFSIPMYWKLDMLRLRESYNFVTISTRVCHLKLWRSVKFHAKTSCCYLHEFPPLQPQLWKRFTSREYIYTIDRSYVRGIEHIVGAKTFEWRDSKAKGGWLENK